MASVPKRQKSKEELDNRGNELRDRLSTLPDEILIHILSFLPTKYAVGTCILSKRWETLWASIPYLDFNQELLLHPERLRHMRRDVNAKYFIKFVDRVLHSFNLSSIRRFCLKAHDVDKFRISSSLTEWVSFIIRRHVEEIEIDYSNDSYVFNLDLPKSLFTCKSLSVLKLKCELEVPIPDLVHFPNLKIFHISLVDPQRDLLQKLFYNCPLLEELLIDTGLHNDEDGITLNVFAPALKRLSIRLERGCLINGDPGEHNVVINAPKLEYLTITDWETPICLMEDSQSLIKAFVNVGAYDLSWQVSPNSETTNRLHGLLRAISNVRVLSLSVSTLALLNYGNTNDMPMFDNLTGLRLDVVDCGYLKVLPYLLKCSPNLQYLSLNKDTLYESDFGKNLDLVLPSWVPNCLLFQLRSIEFVNCLGHRDELKVIKYLLKNTKLLKKMNFLFKGLVSKEKKKFLAQTLLSQPPSKMFRVLELKNISECQCFKWESSEIQNYQFVYAHDVDYGFLLRP